MSDTQVRWRPIDFWPGGTRVTIDAGGTRSSFRVGESLVATVDDTTKQMAIVRNGTLVKTFPVSLGKPEWETPNGTYYVLEKFADIVMDSSTFGLRVDAPEGYRIDVKDAARLSNAGIFVHGAPGSTAAQGARNVTDGGLYTQNDGAQDWQI